VVGQLFILANGAMVAAAILGWPGAAGEARAAAAIVVSARLGLMPGTCTHGAIWARAFSHAEKIRAQISGARRAQTAGLVRARGGWPAR
jgi:hypothetical protein